MRLMKIKPYLKPVFWGFVQLIVLSGISSCDKYLDVVPDNVATLEDAFSLRQNAENYLFSCYSYLPRNGDANFNIGLLAGDEIWFDELAFGSDAPFFTSRGAQSVVSPFYNSWTGGRGASPSDRYGLYRAIRECNTFIENVSDYTKIPDIEDSERERWLAEVKFLKAYYHFYLLRMYGPIPVMRENISISAPEEEVQVSRDPVDECVDYIVGLLDESALILPNIILNRGAELGRVTAPVALALKAKVLLMAASPLFNGNSDMASLMNKDGTPLFNQNVDASKWQLAADAAKEAIDAAESAGHALFIYVNETPYNLSDTTLQQLTLRQAFSERWSDEVIWPNTQSMTTNLQFQCIPPLQPGVDNRIAQGIFSAPLKMAKMFYTKNGVPIEEDRTLDFTRENMPRVATDDERFYIENEGTTARLNFDREPRFYASLGFDRGVWYKRGELETTDENTFVLHALNGEYGGSSHTFFFNVTGYYIKKLVDYNIAIPVDGVSIVSPYAWPEIRLSDLYLMYAEALNEAGAGESVALEYVNRVRERAGLESVQSAWSAYSLNAGKYTTVEGRREIIHRERCIELAFEGQRFWDLMRWKKAIVEFNQPITGWFVKGQEYTSYYQPTTLWNKEFVSPRDYFWPIAEQDIVENPNLVQNIGW